MPAQSVSEALWRYGGMYGSAWRDNQMLAEVVNVTAAAEINRIEVPIVGATNSGHKPGRETREGTISIQKVDARWEHEIWLTMSAGLPARRAARDAKTLVSRSFDLSLLYDDPDALGAEEWVLYGCQIWRLPLGFAVTDDLVEREFPLTWETEKPLSAFRATKDSGGNTAPDWFADTTAYKSTGDPYVRSW